MDGMVTVAVVVLGLPAFAVAVSGSLLALGLAGKSIVAMFSNAQELQDKNSDGGSDAKPG